jgi:sporulation-control protein
MGFMKKMKASMGVGAAEVETDLSSPHCYPGGVVSGQVAFKGGQVEQKINFLAVHLQAQVEVEGQDSEWLENVVFHTDRLSGEFTIGPGQASSFPFQMAIPWETPITNIGGSHLRGMKVGVKTELDIAGGRDAFDFDELEVLPLPVHERILGALINLGFTFTSSDVEKGRAQGSQMPFYQEIEFRPGGQYAGKINELELTFLTQPHAVEVLLELDNRGGFFTEGNDTVTRFSVPTSGFEATNWEEVIHQQIVQAGSRRGLFW